FRPRQDALHRFYLYQIATRRTAFAKPYCWWVRERLNLDPMREAVSDLVGRHDFERFADKRMDDRSTIVVVEHVEIASDGDLILFRIGASHFLWKMVRRIVGALVLIGTARLAPEDLRHLLRPQPLPDRLRALSIAAHTAP